VNSEMPWEPIFNRVWRCTCRPRLSELRDALECCHQTSLQKNMEAKIESTPRGTSTARSSAFGDALGARDRASLEIHMSKDRIQ
jgi:hypothetical protein